MLLLRHERRTVLCNHTLWIMFFLEVSSFKYIYKYKYMCVSVSSYLRVVIAKPQLEDGAGGLQSGLAGLGHLQVQLPADVLQLQRTNAATRGHLADANRHIWKAVFPRNNVPIFFGYVYIDVVLSLFTHNLTIWLSLLNHSYRFILTELLRSTISLNCKT